MASGLGKIFSMRLDDKKDIQSVRSAWSTCIQALKPASYSLSREIYKDEKKKQNKKKKTLWHKHKHTRGGFETENL